MQLVTVQFDRGSGDDFKKLMDVFRLSVKRNMPEAALVELTVPEVPEVVKGLSYKMTSNTAKLDVWCEYMEGCEEEVIFIDCDMLMLRSAMHAFDEPFDVAYTRRSVVGQIPLNAGVIMARPTEKARGFFRKWRDVNRIMYEKQDAFCKEWQAKYPGMNQAALGYLIESGDYDADLYTYETRQWNAVECDWAHINDSTVFVHFKGKLREVLRHRKPFPPVYKAMEAWYEEAGIEVPRYDSGSSHSRRLEKKLQHIRKMKKMKAII